MFDIYDKSLATHVVTGMLNADMYMYIYMYMYMQSQRTLQYIHERNRQKKKICS